MAAPHNDSYKETAIVQEKSDKRHAEYAADEEGKAVGNIDYSGSHEKTDPKEIALVKKLDRWIMPTLWGMCAYFFGTFDFGIRANYLYRLAQLPRPECHRSGASE